MGISFSALELPIRAPGGDAAIKTLADIDRKAQQMSQEINASLGAFDRLGKQLDVTDRQAVKAFRASAAAERDWLNVSRANTDQHARLTQTIQAVDQRMQRAAPNFHRAANASVTMASGIEQLARTGNVAGEGLKQVISQGSNIAFMFGTTGPIIGAIGILGVAMFNFWDRRAREVRDARVQMLSELESLARGSDLVGVTTRQQHLYSGDPFALRKPGESDAAFRARSGGLQVLRPRLAELERQLPQGTLDQLRGKDGRAVAAMTEHMLGGINPLIREYAELQRLVSQMEDDYRKTTEIVNRLTDAENRRARNGQEIAAGERAQAAAIKDANLARERALQLAQEGLRLGKGGSSGLALSLTTSGVEGASNRMLDAAFGMPHPNNPGPQVKLPKANSALDLIKKSEYGRLVLQYQQEVLDPMAATLEAGIATTIGAAVHAGFAAGFSGDGLDGIFASFGTAVLRGIGGIFMQLGAVWIEYGLMMTELTAGLFNPVTSGPTALAIGALLVGLGAALGAVGAGWGSGGGYRGGASTGGITQIIDRGIINPVASPRGSSVPITPREPVTNNIWVIGENDPRAQSTLRRMVFANRGSL